MFKTTKNGNTKFVSKAAKREATLILDDAKLRGIGLGFYGCTAVVVRRTGPNTGILATAIAGANEQKISRKLGMLIALDRLENGYTLPIEMPAHFLDSDMMGFAEITAENLGLT